MSKLKEKSNFNETISVIVPVYNAENYLEECLDSIINQTYTNLEIILIDDGSTDNSATICDNYALKDNRIKVIHKTNGGLSDARNDGIANSTSDYITWVDNDDLVKADYVEILFKALKENDADMSVCKHQRFKTKPTITDEPYSISILSSDEVLEKFGGVNSELGVMVWGKMYKRSQVAKFKFRSDGTDDLGTTYKYFDSANKICFINKVLYYYRNLPNSLCKRESITNKKLNDIEELAVFLKGKKLSNPYVLKIHFYIIFKMRKMGLTDNKDMDLDALRERYLKALVIHKSELPSETMTEYLLTFLSWHESYDIEN